MCRYLWELSWTLDCPIVYWSAFIMTCASYQNPYITLSSFQIRSFCCREKKITDSIVTDSSLSVRWSLKINGWSSPGSDFFFCKRGLPSPNISANHMARILSTSYVHVHVHTRTVNVCAMLMISYVVLKYAPYDWLKCNPRLQKIKSRPAKLTIIRLNRNVQWNQTISPSHLGSVTWIYKKTKMTAPW